MLDDVATATRAQLAAALDAAPPPRALMAIPRVAPLCHLAPIAAR